MGTLIKSALLFLLMLMSGAAWSCTIDVASSMIDFGEHELNSSPESTEMMVSVRVTCPAGVAYRVYPRSTSTNSAFYLPVTNNGVSNGTIYMLMKRLDGVLMKNADYTTQISGVGTGAPQEHQVIVFLTGSASTPSTPVNKAGTFNLSSILFRVIRLDTNAFYEPSAQQITGRITASCTISSGGNIDFGLVPVPSVNTNFEAQTTLTVNCTNGLPYRIYADNPVSSSNSWVNNKIEPVPGQYINISFVIRPSGTSQFKNVSNTLYASFTGNGSSQAYDFNANMFVSPGQMGQFNFVITPTIRF